MTVKKGFHDINPAPGTLKEQEAKSIKAFTSCDCRINISVEESAFVLPERLIHF
jgi:hypothetical protein